MSAQSKSPVVDDSVVISARISPQLERQVLEAVRKCGFRNKSELTAQALRDFLRRISEPELIVE